VIRTDKIATAELKALTVVNVARMVDVGYGDKDAMADKGAAADEDTADKAKRLWWTGWPRTL
jgi:hypothetical protein